MPKLKQSILSIVIGLALAAGISYAATWTGPFANPPDDNVPAPLNVGEVSQAKTGTLYVGDAFGIGGLFHAYGPATFDGKVTIADGTQCEGCILVSNADGLASWQDFFGGGGGSSNSSETLSVNQNHGLQMYGGGAVGSFVVSAGVTKLMVSVNGGGGGGGMSIGGIGSNGGGGGGGGGFVSGQEISVSPGQIFTVTVGMGGESGKPGGTSSFGNFIVATGGKAGGNATKSAPGKGGIGGAVTVGGVVKNEYSGWNGVDGASNVSGGGGGCNITQTLYWGGSIVSSGEEPISGNICGGGGGGTGSGIPGGYGGQGIVQVNW